MTEVVLDHLHPLDRYLEESLDDAFYLNMPGAADELAEASDATTVTAKGMEDDSKWKPVARWAIQAIATVFEYAHITDAPAIEFAERFKYVVISSSLLDTSLSPSSALPYVFRFLTPPATPSTAPAASSVNTPGDQRPDATNDIDLRSQAPSSLPTTPSPAPTQPPWWRHVWTSPTIRRNTPVLVLLFVLVLNGYVFLGLLSLFALKTNRTKEREAQAQARATSYNSTLDALQSLISANNVWTVVVNEAMGILEHEEKRLFYGPSLPNSPSSSIRAALSSSLANTQTQTDTVRQLFTPLTSASQLSKLSEMYAPPPPTPKPIFASGSPGHQRPLSLTATLRPARSSISAPSSSEVRRSGSLKEFDKRSTWSGATSRAAMRGSVSLQGMAPVTALPGPSRPGPSTFETPNKRRLSTVFGEDAEPSTPFPTPTEMEEKPASAPALESKLPLTPSKHPGSRATTPTKHIDDPFTAAPMLVRRRRRNSSVSAGSPASSAMTTAVRPHSADDDKITPLKINHSRSHNSLSVVTPSRLQTTRHPMSMAALNEQLQAAMASKRFASAHLLALRFGHRASAEGEEGSGNSEELELLDGDDESYWEDVRSVMSLLTSALEDASGSLSEALEQSRQEKEKDMQPSPFATTFPGRTAEAVKGSRLSIQAPLTDPLNSSLFKRMSLMSSGSPSTLSFAPMPNHLARFADHADALVDAMDNAKAQLEECVAVVKGLQSQQMTGQAAPKPLEAAIQTYDKVRKDLSTALREFERGRGSLLDFVKHQNALSSMSTGEAEQDAEDDDGVPALAHDQSSNEDSDDRHGPLLPVHSAIYDGALEHGTLTSLSVTIEDPASQHLLLSTDPTQLPQPHGLEQVFAYDSKDEPQSNYTRERSKLSREERIALAKAKRASTSAQQQAGAAKSDTAWGPGGEVVQELKTVISRVEDLRKKEAEKRLSILGELATSPSPTSPVARASFSSEPATPPPVQDLFGVAI